MRGVLLPFKIITQTLFGCYGGYGLLSLSISSVLIQTGCIGICGESTFSKAVYTNEVSQSKKDKSDAKAICEYGQMNEVPLYTALPMYRVSVYSYFGYWIII